MTKKLLSLSVSFVLLALGASIAQAEERSALLESMEGNQVEMIRPDGTKQAAAAGSEIPAGARIKTGPQTAARILFEDQSEIVLGQSTELKVDSAREGAIAATLEEGHLRTRVTKTTDPQSQTKPHRFVIRTPSAVMGVRGTEFTVDADRAGGTTQIHTLDGRVEIARDLNELRTKPLHRLDPGVSVRSIRGQFEAPQHFDRMAFVRDYAARHPFAHRLALVRARTWRELRKVKTGLNAPSKLRDEPTEHRKVRRRRHH